MEELERFGLTQENWENFTDWAWEFIPNLITAILLLIVGLWIIRVITRMVKKFFAKKDYDITLEKFLADLINWGLKILLFITVITQLGVKSTSLVAILGAAGLAVGLALQGSLSNFAGGVIILLFRPFRVGDWISAQGVDGAVKEINIFTTKLNTFGNQLAVIPNGKLSNDNIINYTIEGKRRDNIAIGISYGSDIKKAKDILMNLLDEQEQILTENPPQVVVTELADSSVNLAVRFWAMNEDFWDVHFYVIEEAKRRLEAGGINIPFPQQEVRIVNIQDYNAGGKKEA